MKTTVFPRWIIPILVLGSVFIAAFTATAQNYYPADIGNKWVLENDKIGQQLTYTLEKPESPAEQEYILLKIETVKKSAGNPDKLMDLDKYFLTDAPDAVKLHKTILQQDIFGKIETIAANFPTPVVFFPKVLKLGDKWQITADTEILGISVTTISNLEVVAFEDAVTPAGTFENCAKVELELSIKGPVTVAPTKTHQWLAPNVGPVKFQNNVNRVFRLVSSNLLTPGVTLAGVGALTKHTSNASAGVNYTLNITNTGSTNDTFRLSTSGNVSATLSRSTVSLAPKASTQVTVRIDDPALSAAGSYAVKVTATSQNDTTQTAEATTTTTVLPVYGVTLAGVGDLTKQTADATAGVNYTLNITNTGNINDTFRLSTSGDVSATLSQTTVSLGRAASTQVTLTVDGPALSAAGSYAVKVTATSQNDTTQTAEATTTTTVLPIYGVTLAGVGDLAKQTADATAGVSYTLNITNTSNINDTFRLSASGEANATVSQYTVSLAPGASTQVTVKVTGAALSAAGSYAVKVTATSQSDSTKTAAITATTTILPVYDIALAAVGALAKETSDAGTGVTYTLKITNTGNTDDTIVLDSSAGFGIEGSVLGTFTATSSQGQQVSELGIALAAGASAEAIFTAAGDVFTKSGEYTIEVTATSQGDSTKTAAITTTTTILPVYGSTLAGVGALTKETSDASTGVNYTLNITNTGNTDDTIVLDSSAGFGIEGSVLGTFTATSSQGQQVSELEIALAAGASAEAIFTAAGDVFTKSGEYTIEVTATSQGDSTKTAAITTTTTVLPIYGITLIGIGELTKEIATAGEPVNYTLNITNTGNTADVIDITTTGDVAATLSQSTVSLSAGASAEVTMTVDTAALPTAGDYAVMVTATSPGGYYTHR